MRRHQQNISFVAIIGILMSFAFFFSQQNNTNSANDSNEADSLLVVENLDDLPDCSLETNSEAEAICLANAVALSDQLVEMQVDAFLALEEDTGKRMAFIETQSSWEGSRNADCLFLGGLNENDELRDIAKNACLLDQNLERIGFLEDMICNNYDSSGCESQ